MDRPEAFNSTSAVVLWDDTKKWIDHLFKEVCSNKKQRFLKEIGMEEYELEIWHSGCNTTMFQTRQTTSKLRKHIKMITGNRQPTLEQRKNSLMEKTIALSILHNYEIVLVLFTSQGKLTQYASGNIDQTLTKFVDAPLRMNASYTNDSYEAVLADSAIAWTGGTAQCAFDAMIFRLMADAIELSVLFDCEIALVIFTSEGNLKQYASSNIDRTLSKFIDAKPAECYTNDSYDEMRGKQYDCFNPNTGKEMVEPKEEQFEMTEAEYKLMLLEHWRERVAGGSEELPEHDVGKVDKSESSVVGKLKSPSAPKRKGCAKPI